MDGVEARYHSSQTKKKERESTVREGMFRAHSVGKIWSKREAFSFFLSLSLSLSLLFLLGWLEVRL